jgi:hypothetical protein
MLVPTHVSSCQSWCSCCPSSTKRFKENLKIPAQAFISQPPQGVLEWFWWWGAFVTIVAIGYPPPSLQTPIASTRHPLPLLIMVLLCALSLLPWFCSSWWSWCHGLATHHGLVTCHGLVPVFALHVPGSDLYLYFVGPCSCRGHALLHQFFWEVYHIKYSFTLGEVDFWIIEVVVREVVNR